MQDPAELLQGRSRETTIARDAQGRWFQDGQPLEHPNLTRSFDRWIDRAEDGRYCLKNDINWAYITLQGPAFFVRSVEQTPAGLTLLLSNDSKETLRPETLRSGEDGALYCDVAAGRMVARFDRNAAAALEALLHEDEQGVYLAIAGQRIRPRVVSDPLEPCGAGG
jgi:uncharacterized protein